MDGERLRQIGASERVSGWTGFLWGFAEGLFFFIVPDVYVTFATLFSWRSGAIAWLASIAGSVVAVGATYALAVVLGVDYVGALPLVPGIQPAMLEQISTSMRAEGLPYTPFLIFGGVPLKVYAGIAFSLGISLGSVAIWTVFARVVRIAPVFALAAGARFLFRGAIERAPTRWTVLLAVLWIVFYTFYLSRMGW